MKNIKEKAEENCVKYGSLGDVAYQEFVAGANYVLDLLIAEDDKYDTVMECYCALASLIRELKSNQK